MTTSIFLLPTTWDLCIDSKGNIATATDDYEIAQNVASACRLWLGESMFDRKRGIPYKFKVLGYRPDGSLLNSWFKTEAETVNGVTAATPVLDIQNRELVGYIEITTEDSGETYYVRL